MKRNTAGWRIAATLLAGFVCHAQTGYDIVLRNGRIVDGTGAPWYRADIGVRAGKIAAIGRLEGAGSARVIDLWDSHLGVLRLLLSGPIVVRQDCRVRCQGDKHGPDPPLDR